MTTASTAIATVRHTAALLWAAVLAGCNSDSRRDVLAPSRLAVSEVDPVSDLKERLSRIQVFRFQAPIAAAGTEVEASFTHDGHTMYFTCSGRRPGTETDICVSHLKGNFEDGEWTEPEVLLAISTPDREVEPKISPSGKRLYFQSNRLEPGDADGIKERDIYYSDLVNGEWQEPVRLPPPINTEFEDHCLYFEDMRAYDDLEIEAVAYMASTRPGTLGSNDIWVTRRVNGVFQAPVNLNDLSPNSKINSAANDHMAMLGPDGRLWVTTTRGRAEGGFGDEDLWLSLKQPTGEWGPLINMGEKFNTPWRELCVDFVMGKGKGGLMRNENGITHAKGNVIYGVFGSSRSESEGEHPTLDLYYFRLDELLIP